MQESFLVKPPKVVQAKSQIMKNFWMSQQLTLKKKNHVTVYQLAGESTIN